MAKKLKTPTPPNDAIFGEDLATFGAGVPTIDGGPCIDDIESEMAEMPHLADDLRHEAQGISREFRDARQLDTAAQAIRRIPGPSEAFHILISGRFALWQTVPAVLQLAAPQTIAALHVATLGFSKGNIAELVALIDTGAIAAVSLLCSHYFKGTSTEIFDYARAELATRPAARFLSLRTHAKLIAMRLSDGRTVTVESSANLRSCKNIEQMTLIGDPNLYAHHIGWIDQLFAMAAGSQEATA